MAEHDDDTERTEDPTQRRLEQAHERGDVAKSQEVNTWFIMAAGALVVYGFAGSLGGDMLRTFRGVIANSYKYPADGPALVSLAHKIGVDVLAAIAIPLLLLVLAAIGGNIIQHRFVWSLESLTPKFSKVSPAAGLKRLFSKQALLNFIKGLIKLTVVGGVLFALLWPERHRLELMVSFDPFYLLVMI